MTTEGPRDKRGGRASAPASAVDGAAMAGLFTRTEDGTEPPGDFDELSLALTRAYCFSMDSGLGALRAAGATQAVRKARDKSADGKESP